MGHDPCDSHRADMPLMQRLAIYLNKDSSLDWINWKISYTFYGEDNFVHYKI